MTTFVGKKIRITERVSVGIIVQLKEKLSRKQKSSNKNDYRKKYIGVNSLAMIF